MNIFTLSQPPSRRRASFTLALIFAALLASGRIDAGAAVISWTGATNAFLTPGNWSGNNTPPISGDSLVFGGAGAGGLLLNNNLTNGSFGIAGMTFNAGAGAFIIGNGTTAANAGNSFLLTGDITNNSTSLQTINNPFSMTTVRTFMTTPGGGNITLGGNVSGTGGGINVAGGGTLTLTGTNTYTGGTTISSGTLQLGAGGASGSIAGNVTNNGTMIFNRSDDFTFGGVISGSGGLVKNGNIVRFSAAQTYTGPTIINSGSLTLSTTVDQGLSASTVVTIAAGAILDISSRAQTFAGLSGAGTVFSAFTSSGSLGLNVASGQTYTFSGTMGGAYPNFAFSKSGQGTQILSGANTYTGTTTINGGTLQIGSHGTTGSLPAGSAITNNGTLTFDRTNLVEQGRDFGLIGGSGQFIQQGGGLLVLNGTNTYSGGTTISNGTLQIGAGGAVGSILGNVTNNGTLVFHRSGDFIFGGVISGTGGVMNNGNIVRFSAAQTYAGPTH